MCGDLNARTGLITNFIADDSKIPMSSPPSYVVDNEIPRHSKDVTINTQGRHLLDLCIGSRLRIVNEGLLKAVVISHATPLGVVVL